MIIEDDKADPVLIAADLISEVKHGMTSSATLITDSLQIAKFVQRLFDEQLKLLPDWRRKYAESKLTFYGGIVIVRMLTKQFH